MILKKSINQIKKFPKIVNELSTSFKNIDETIEKKKTVKDLTMSNLMNNQKNNIDVSHYYSVEEEEPKISWETEIPVETEEIMFDRETLIKNFHNEMINNMMNKPEIQNMSNTDRELFFKSAKINSVDCMIDQKEKTKYIGPSNNPYGFDLNQTYTCIDFNNMIMNQS